MVFDNSNDDDFCNNCDKRAAIVASNPALFYNPLVVELQRHNLFLYDGFEGRSGDGC